MLSVGADHDAPSAAISADGVVKRYGETTAVDHASLSIPVGLVLGIVGPNSAGKTTLIECIEGIRTPDEGRIAVLGLDNIRDAQQIKQRIGVQLQKTGFFPDLTLRETLDLYASLYRRAHDVPDLLRRLAIDDKARTLVKDTSGGIFQRLSLAVALVNDPDLIFLDEPTTGLDPQASRGVWEIVRELKASGRTVLLTTHYMDEAYQLCDQVAIMHQGRIIAQDTPDEFVRRYAGKSLVELVPPRTASQNHFRQCVLPTLPGVQQHWIQGKRLLVSSDDPPALMKALLELEIPEMKMREGTLEDVFLKIADRGPES